MYVYIYICIYIYIYTERIHAQAIVSGLAGRKLGSTQSALQCPGSCITSKLSPEAEEKGLM